MIAAAGPVVVVVAFWCRNTRSRRFGGRARSLGWIVLLLLLLLLWCGCGCRDDDGGGGGSGGDDGRSSSAAVGGDVVVRVACCWREARSCLFVGGLNGLFR